MSLLNIRSWLALRCLGGIASGIAMLAACSGGGGGGGNDSTGVEPPQQPARDYCTELQAAHCLYPFPSNLLTRADSSSATGLRINFSTEAMPKNVGGVVVDPTEWNRNDGFSPGSTLLAQVPGLDVTRTGLPTLAHQQRSLDADSPVVVIDADSGERQLVWAELNGDPLPSGEVALLIHSAKNFDYGRRYIVALRNLKNASGDTIGAESTFSTYRDGGTFTDDILEGRRAAMDDIFTRLGNAGIARGELFLAWDFTVASSASISNRIVHMRDETLAALGDAAPVIQITSVTAGNELADAAQQEHLARLVRGTIAVPNYLDGADGGPGTRFHYGSDDVDALPARLTEDAVLNADFICAIPKSALAAPANRQQRARPVIMAHGLFQNREMVPRFAAYADANKLVLCGMNWIGMSSDDAAITAQVLADFGKFPTTADRLQQGYLNNIVLTRALMASDGLASLPAFRSNSSNSRALFNNEEVYFEGISQGSVLGGGFYAVSPDIRYGSLVAAGMNFSLLMQRSDAWPTYRALFTPAYPNGLDQSLLMSMVQMLWDRGEINGYAATLNSANAGIPGTPQKLTLIQSAVGDQRVTETSAEILARTIGALQHAPRTVAGRHIGDVPYLNIDVMTYPSIESGYTVWDRGPFPRLVGGEIVDGTPLQLEGNAPNVLGVNPHETPIRDPLPTQQRAALIWQHQIINVCGSTACLAEGYDGTPGEYNPANAPAEGETVSL